MKRLLIAAVGIAALAAMAVLFWGSPRGPVDDRERNRKFTEDMAGVTLVGNSTFLNRQGMSGTEHYFIDSVKHVSGDAWLFQTRLEFKGSAVPVPIPLRVEWAGDTPVITLTDLVIPGVGKYTARVVLYRGQYAGTWSGENAGGQLFGRIERQAAQ